ncbi:MAG TPA: hypothetical protein VFK78_01405 [Gemmatimonadales bacterium]|nr:hypothetical protein [Gemmatimonadales bacterium]
MGPARAPLVLLTLLCACVAREGGAFPGCPLEGEAVSPAVRALNRLKNRALTPAPADLDREATIAGLLAPGDDRDRWSERSAATVVGYVRDVRVGGVETVNCYAREVDRRDTHLELVADPEDRGALPVIAEVTPGWRAFMARRGSDWSTDSLRAALAGRWVRVTGWLMFDAEHARQAENTASGNPGNWRQTAWELHPVTALEVVAPPPR